MLFAKLAALTTVVAAFSGCIEMSDDYASSHSYRYSSYEYDGNESSSLEDGGREETCKLPRGAEPARDPLHIQETRDVHGYVSTSWDWMLAACKIIAYNVTFKVGGTTDHLDAVAVTFHVELRDPKGHSVVEERDTAVLSESRTALNWTLKPGSKVVPGEWSLRFSAAGDLQYDVEVYLEY